MRPPPLSRGGRRALLPDLKRRKLAAGCRSHTCCYDAMQSAQDRHPSRPAVSSEDDIAIDPIFATEEHVMKYNLVVDGKSVTVDADPAMPLLYALRSELGLNNPKFGCGRAQCGACTVHVDGAPTRSCVTPVNTVAGKKMTAAAFLRDTPKPTDAQIRTALTGLKCRCGTHMAIMRAVKRAAGTTA